MNLRQISKKIFIARVIISIILMIIFMIIGVYLLISNMTQHHFHGAPKYMLSNLDDKEQAEILDAFDLTIPENEAKAYVYSFSYGAVDERLYSYTVEIAGVKDYEGFYAANRQQKSFNETTSNFRTDRSYYIVYKGSVDTMMEKNQHDKYSALYNKIQERKQ